MRLFQRNFSDIAKLNGLPHFPHEWKDDQITRNSRTQYVWKSHVKSNGVNWSEQDVKPAISCCNDGIHKHGVQPQRAQEWNSLLKHVPNRSISCDCKSVCVAILDLDVRDRFSIFGFGFGVEIKLCWDLKYYENEVECKISQSSLDGPFKFGRHFLFGFLTATVLLSILGKAIINKE